MAKKLSKAQGRRRLLEIRSKAVKLFEAGYISLKDMDAFDRITKARRKQLK